MCQRYSFNEWMKSVCGGWDLNPRMPAQQDLKSCTFGRLVLPSSNSSMYLQILVLLIFAFSFRTLCKDIGINTWVYPSFVIVLYLFLNTKYISMTYFQNTRK